MNTYGIVKLKQVLKFGFGVGSAAKKSFADGKIDMSDAQFLVPLLPEFLPLIDDIDQAPKEFSDLDENEVAELLAFGAAELGGLVESEKLVSQVKASLKVGIAVIELIKTFRL